MPNKWIVPKTADDIPKDVPIWITWYGGGRRGVSICEYDCDRAWIELDGCRWFADEILAYQIAEIPEPYFEVKDAETNS